jgi:pimeloyl-ACP methyl ester carboxylesterase
LCITKWPQPQPFVRRTGSGPTVVCFHCNASSSAQWRGLMDQLAPAFTVHAPDSYGAGKSPEWPSDRTITLDDEVRLVENLILEAPDKPVLVGHSYGAAIALMAALRHPQKVRALALYEPTLFALEEAAVPSPNGVEGIRLAVALAGQALDAGDADSAARHFIDFWMGAGSWAATPAERKPAIEKSVSNVRRWGHALMTEPTPLAAFSALTMPVLYMIGRRSPESAQAVARRLVPALQRVTVQTLEDLGHMAPVTHAETVNAVIAEFFRDL